MTHPHVVVLGVAPASRGARAWAADSASGVRLAELAGIFPERLDRLLALDNLCDYPEPARSRLRMAGQGYAFLPRWRYLLAGTEVVRGLGRRAFVGQAVGDLPWHGGRQPWQPLVWYLSDEGVEMAVLPHPSGRNRWYNDLGCRHAAEVFIRSCLTEAAGGVHATWLRVREAARLRAGARAAAGAGRP